MKSLGKTVPLWMATVALISLMAAYTQAEFVVDDWNWDNSVFDYSANIMNHGGTLMDESTKWWLTGQPDADANGDGYWDEFSEPDYLGGWKFNAPGECITMYWEAGIPDVVGNDLITSMYSGPLASAIVSASTDGVEFTQIGTIGSGTPCYFRQEYFDFAGVFDGRVLYVKVVRVGNGSQTGMFFDAFGAAPVPEPGAIALMATGLIALLVLRCRYQASSF